MYPTLQKVANYHFCATGRVRKNVVVISAEVQSVATVRGTSRPIAMHRPRGGLRVYYRAGDRMFIPRDQTNGSRAAASGQDVRLCRGTHAARRAHRSAVA